MIRSQKENNKGADQSVRLRRLVCAFVVRKPGKRQFFFRVEAQKADHCRPTSESLFEWLFVFFWPADDALRLYTGWDKAHP